MLTRAPEPTRGDTALADSYLQESNQYSTLAAVNMLAIFDEAGDANQHGEDYDLAATLLTVVLFFSGIAVVINDNRIQWTLLAVSGVLLIGSSGYMLLSLPIQ